MDLFRYRDGQLFCEDVPAGELAERFGTPLYVYSAGTIVDHFEKLTAAFSDLKPLICFSVKSCSNIHICSMLAQRGAGFDVVSGGELFRVIAAGGDPAKCCFAGPSKSDEEIRYALENGLRLFNIESEAELENLRTIAYETGATAHAALRVNPDVDPKTHRHITTGKKENKFGVDIERAEKVFCRFAAPNTQNPVRLDGIHLHIGSQITAVKPYVESINKALALIDRLAKLGIEIRTLDFGGGFAANYQDDEALEAREFAKHIVPLLKGRGLDIVMEPGRFISGNAGILLTRVQYVKQAGDKKFLLIDAGMNDLIRPALYGSYHHIWPVAPGEEFMPRQKGYDEKFPGTELVDVAGPVCESADVLGRERHLPPCRRGDILAVFTAGAYGMVMSSNYNSHRRPPEGLGGGTN
ncbi:MAG: diaminopimelate decarboxylase, partial [Planctomycetia bacterium]|nr:diaminopimelate decarboxylase [Planctomycetia bacterium]